MSRVGAPGAVLPLLTESKTEVSNLLILYNFYESLEKASLLCNWLHTPHIFSICVSNCNASEFSYDMA
jgi:hypothetical protein